MAPLGGHLVGYLSMFLQLGVLVLVAGLAVLVRASLGRRTFDGWVAGLLASAAALAVLAAAAIGHDLGSFRTTSGATVAYALLEDLAALSFIVACGAGGASRR